MPFLAIRYSSETSRSNATAAADDDDDDDDLRRSLAQTAFAARIAAISSLP
jgi:hypothetical protein